MESIETVITVTTTDVKKAHKFRAKKEKEGFTFDAAELTNPALYKATYKMTLSKLEQFK